jgi:predicted XRE-type DNA-binding protein
MDGPFRAHLKLPMKQQTFASVWDALEESADGAATMRVRAELMIVVQRYVAAHNGTQAEAAKLLGITQPRLNDLLRGRIDRFGLDALAIMLARITH